MKKLLTLALVAFAICPLQIVARTGHPIEKQLITVKATYQQWNEYRPWQKSKPQNRTFLGTVVSGNRILIPSFYIQNATLIQFEKGDRPPRVPARILHRDDQVGLALLTTDEPGFFDDLNPVKIAEQAEGESFYCAAWKSSQLSLSSCRWSQVKGLKSAVPYFGYAGIYFISDLKNGGRGEPVFNDDDRMIGIVKSQSSDRITVLPSELIQSYLRMTELPDYPGFGRLGINYQENSGRAQAAYFGMNGMPTGIRVMSCIPASSTAGILQKDDILLELDGHSINSEGYYEHPRFGQMSFNLIATDGHQAGDILKANVLRNKQEITLDIPLKNMQPDIALIPQARPNQAPPYLMAGGLVFRELDEPYLRAWGDKWKNNIPPTLRILYQMKANSPTPDQKRLIILTDVFPDEYNLGYHSMAQTIVKSVNGHSIDSIQELEEAFRHPQDGFHIIDFVPTFGTSRVILDADTFDSATERIMKTYQIPSRMRLK